jgi:hypothetical protein
MLEKLSDEQLGKLAETINKEIPQSWVPNKGAQTMAFLSEADELYFGGAAGGGKSALLCGLATTSHEKSIIFRREYPQIKGLEDEVVRTDGSFVFFPTGFYHPSHDVEMTFTSGSDAVTYALPSGGNAYAAEFPVGAAKATLATANSLTPVLEASSDITASSSGSITLRGNARRTTVDRAGIWIVPKT